MKLRWKRERFGLNYNGKKGNIVKTRSDSQSGGISPILKYQWYSHSQSKWVTLQSNIRCLWLQTL